MKRKWILGTNGSEQELDLVNPVWVFCFKCFVIVFEISSLVLVLNFVKKNHAAGFISKIFP